ncbi:MAG: tetratricopeptide repeat protein [Acidobacteriota bacterium]
MAPSRIDELRRRVQNDPASIAFAQLAEEYRRSGQTAEAVRVCREGLTRHPGYLSARVTLGRALLDLSELSEAREELEFVVAEAPENLAAVRGLAEIFHREGLTAEALNYYQRALALARHDPEIEEIVQQLSRTIGAATASPNNGLSFEEAHQELLSAAERLPLAPKTVDTTQGRNADEGATAPFDFDRLVAALGTPSAPPQLEAAVAGIPTAVQFVAPDVVSLGPDPFAALEAELRASEAAGVADKVAPWSPPDAVTPAEAVAAEPDLAVAMPDVLEVSAPLAETIEEVAAFVATQPEPAHAADSFPSADEGGLDSFPIASAAQLDDFVDSVDLTSAQLAADDPETPAVAEARPVVEVAEVVGIPEIPEVSEVLAPAQPDAPTVAAVQDAPEVLETLTALGVVIMESPQAELLEAPEAGPVTAEQPASRSEGVLDELENWLSTLQDRSSQ